VTGNCNQTVYKDCAVKNIQRTWKNVVIIFIYSVHIAVFSKYEGLHYKQRH